jgi:hypothetical protein
VKDFSQYISIAIRVLSIYGIAPFPAPQRRRPRTRCRRSWPAPGPFEVALA